MAKKHHSLVAQFPANHLFLMDIPTVAVRMSTTVFAVRELCRSGQLKYVAIGHKWLISQDAIFAYIRRKEQEPQEAA